MKKVEFDDREAELLRALALDFLDKGFRTTEGPINRLLNRLVKELSP